VSVSDPSIAQVKGVQGGVITGAFFQVVKQTESSVEFRAVDLEDRITPGAENLVLATVGFVGVKGGKTGLKVEVNSLINDEGKRIEPSIELGELEVLAVLKPPAPEPTTGSQEGLSPIGSAERLPQDLDGDGLYEDIDGDGQLTTKDVALFAYNIDSEIIQGNKKLFDFDGDGDVDFDDALQLASFIKIKASPTPFTIIRLEDKRITVEEEVDLNLVLVAAPAGLRRYDITVSVENGRIAQLKGAESGAIDGRFFEVLSQTASSIEFRAADLKDEVRPGAEDLLLATLRLEAVRAGRTAIWVMVNLLTDDQGNEIGPLVRSGRIEVAMFTIGRSAAPPRDLDGDGLFEDINGDGQLTFQDVLIFSFNFTSKAVQENWELFDFDADGDVDFDDAVALASLVEERAEQE
ncbi:MAG: hypothetical protein ACE5KR_03830, partial [Candidatus Bipolaricaulia bacterium]